MVDPHVIATPLCYWAGSPTSYITKSEKSKTFHYKYYKKQISLFLYDLTVSNYTLLCGKCIFNRRNMHVSTKYIFLIKKIFIFNTNKNIFIIINIILLMI